MRVSRWFSSTLHCFRKSQSQIRTQSLFICISCEGSERRLGLGCGVRDAWERIPCEPQPSPIFSHPKDKEIATGYESASVSAYRPNDDVTRHRGVLPATRHWPGSPRLMGRELAGYYLLFFGWLVKSTWKILLPILNTLCSDCFEEWHRNLLERWRSAVKIGEAQLRSDLFNTRLK